MDITPAITDLVRAEIEDATDDELISAAAQVDGEGLLSFLQSAWPPPAFTKDPGPLTVLPDASEEPVDPPEPEIDIETRDAFIESQYIATVIINIVNIITEARKAALAQADAERTQFQQDQIDALMDLILEMI